MGEKHCPGKKLKWKPSKEWNPATFVAGYMNKLIWICVSDPAMQAGLLRGNQLSTRNDGSAKYSSLNLAVILNI